METVFNDFKRYKIADETIISKYKGILPGELIETWERYGFGIFANGFLKVINPDDHLNILESSYIRHEQAIPIFMTAVGDIIVWKIDNYVNLLNYRKGHVSVVSSGFEFFFDDLKDDDFMNDELMWHPYPIAVSKYGAPNYDECFGYTPPIGFRWDRKNRKLKESQTERTSSYYN